MPSKGVHVMAVVDLAFSRLIIHGMFMPLSHFLLCKPSILVTLVLLTKDFYYCLS